MPNRVKSEQSSPAGTAPRASGFGFCKSKFVPENSTDDEAQETKTATAFTTSIMLNHTDAIPFLQRFQSHEDSIARNTAITVCCVNDSKDIMSQALAMMEQNSSALTSGAKMRTNFTSFTRHFRRRIDNYAQDFIAEVGDLARVVDGSAYDFDQTAILNSIEGPELFK
jgi:hypothetical protein